MENNADLEAGAIEVMQENAIDSILNIPDTELQAKVFFNLHRGIKDENLGNLNEANFFRLLKKDFAEDSRISFHSIADGEDRVEYALVRSLQKVDSFLESVIPIVCSDPNKVALGFHDTALYWANKFEKDGLNDPKFTTNGFYVHPERFLGDHFKDIALRSFYYAKIHNLPNIREGALANQLKNFPPKEVVETDFRNARVLVVALKKSFSDRDGNNTLVDLSNIDEVPYEMIIPNPLPPECFIITNVWHPYSAISECTEAGLRSYDTADRFREIYDKYDIDLNTGVHR